VQVEPITPTLKAPGPQRLKLKFDGLLSNFAFKFNMRRYTKACGVQGGILPGTYCEPKMTTVGRGLHSFRST
jgi:hypothetical protein